MTTFTITGKAIPLSVRRKVQRPMERRSTIGMKPSDIMAPLEIMGISLIMRPLVKVVETHTRMATSILMATER